jgi:hypothetical protein
MESIVRRILVVVVVVGSLLTWKKEKMAHGSLSSSFAVWPMYMGARDFKIPVDEIPECAGWAFSISKVWSCAARAGWIIYKKNPVAWRNATVETITNSQTATNGHLSEWTWKGMHQIMDIVMAKPWEDPTSWIGAYTSLVKEKWDYILEAFADCPVIQPTNPYSGAYVWFYMQPKYLGLSGTGTPTFFRDVLGTQTVSRSNQWRGADPSKQYGANYTIYDFTRLNLYRDVQVYKELGRRGKIVCNDFNATIGKNTISVDQWVAVYSAPVLRARRSLTDGPLSRNQRQRILAQAAPDLTAAQIEYVINGQIESERQERAMEKCAPDYTTQCLEDTVGFLTATDASFV